MFIQLRRSMAIAVTGVLLAGSLAAAPALAADQGPQPVPNCTITYSKPASPDRIALWALCNKLTDLTPLAAFPTLESIESGYTFAGPGYDTITDVSPLNKFPALKTLALGGMSNEGMKYLSALPQLASLRISGTFRDVSVLRSLPKLKNVALTSPKLASIETLSVTVDLETISIRSDTLTDLGPLKHNRKLSSVLLVSGSTSTARQVIRVGVPFSPPAVIGINGEGIAPNLARDPHMSQLGSGQLMATDHPAGDMVWEVMQSMTDGMPLLQRYEVNVVKNFDIVPRLENLWWDNIHGPDRYSTSAAISQSAFPTTAPVVYLASGASFPDALVAGPAAAVEGGPLLLTAPTVLPSTVKAEIQRLRPKKVVLVGGPASVSPDVLAAVQKLVPNTVRRSGADRYAVARAVAAATPWRSKTAYVASGQVFPDALSAAAPAGAQGSPVILVPGTASAVDATTTALMLKLGITKTIVAGGPATVSEGMLVSLNRFAPIRVGGADRYAVNRALNADLGKKASVAYFASGEIFTDALAGSAVAAARHAPLYLARKSCISSGILADMQNSSVTRATGFGGYASVNLLPTVENRVPSCG